jgi:signal transduction histidine kinase
MDRAEALQLLRSASPHERLKAAQFFAKQFVPGDLPILRDARQHESVAYVKRRLERAIERARGLPAQRASFDASAAPEPSEILQKEIRAKAVEWVSAALLHELEPRIGQLRVAALREVSNFDCSDVKAHLDRLESVFLEISCLRQAAATPRIEEFDLALLIRDIIVQEMEGKEVKISTQGQMPCMISSDPRLLTLAISNGIRNAIEAVEGSQSCDPHAVIITWGVTEIDYWVVILDRGPGIVGSPEGAFKFGITTKRDHIGFGLAIARQAVDTLEGSVVLTSANGGGARLEFRWDR